MAPSETFNQLHIIFFQKYIIHNVIECVFSSETVMLSFCDNSTTMKQNISTTKIQNQWKLLQIVTCLVHRLPLPKYLKKIQNNDQQQKLATTILNHPPS